MLDARDMLPASTILVKLRNFLKSTLTALGFLLLNASRVSTTNIPPFQQHEQETEGEPFSSAKCIARGRAVLHNPSSMRASHGLLLLRSGFDHRVLQLSSQFSGTGLTGPFYLTA